MQSLDLIMPKISFRFPAALWRFSVAAFVAACVLVCGATDVSAQSLDAARASGVVGERADGYAVIRGDASPEIRNLVDRVNGERRRIYTERARQQRVSPAQVGAVYAGSIASRAPKGTWIQDSSGGWRRK